MYNVCTMCGCKRGVIPSTPLIALLTQPSASPTMRQLNTLFTVSLQPIVSQWQKERRLTLRCDIFFDDIIWFGLLYFILGYDLLFKV